MTEFMTPNAQRRCTWQWFATDFFSAAVASAAVSPWVTAIDKIVYYRAATSASLMSCVRSWLSKPAPSIKTMLIHFLVYFGTYATANMFDSMHARENCMDPATVSATPSKFFATSAVSTGLCVYKDGYFAGMAARSPAPLLSYLLFTTRDVVTVFASFNMPAWVAPKLSQLSLPHFEPFSVFSSEESRMRAAQMLMPAASQLVSTPLHLLGLDLSHRRYKLGIRERISMVRQNMSFAPPLRMVRIILGFGIGNVVNTSCRSSMFARVV